jgi:hypothetical protein
VVSLDLAICACLNAVAFESASELGSQSRLKEKRVEKFADKRMGIGSMQRMADRRGKGPAILLDDAGRAETLLQEVIAILDAANFDRAAAYADMARQALAEATASHAPAEPASLRLTT